MDSIPSNPDEGDLLERVREHDESAFAELFSRYRRRLLRIVKFRLDRRLQGRVDEEDVLQDAYMDASQRAHHFFEMEQPTSFFIWLRMVVGQTLIDVHRRHLATKMRDANREEALNAGFGGDTSVSLSFHLLAHLTSPSQAAMKAELAGIVEEAIGGMSQIDREVLALRHFEELTNNEVAEVLALHRKAASIRYRRALTRLTDVLEKIPGFFDEDEENGKQEDAG
ncbi:MAG: sigma-70 family RNA polymerase sigma factor [Planctomycetota bacterium]|nr:sigma-70 family RNA polymerase sigma factor [Planctomycetota bacterium]